MDTLTAPTVREATEADYPAALAVMQAAFAEFDGQLDPPSGVHGETVASLRQRIGAGGLLLAELDGQLVGMVLYRPEEGQLYMGRLSVLPAFRRRGIGNLLIEAVERRARELGLALVGLSVRIALPGQRASYERQGYRVVSAHAHPGYDQPTFVNMQKTLRI
ncbi:MAG TPA: GNAT family N-acetyltransferase [Roseiflexaceae bacterium]|nr:GNAT family N-acetyltransferase [Roseiflexaceae bacterium]